MHQTGDDRIGGEGSPARTMSDRPVPFTIPPEEDPEPGVPGEIRHECDYMLSPEGSLEYHYNHLIYTWTVGGETISARAYLDEPSTVSVFVKGARLRNEAALAPLVRYLQRRFTIIQSFARGDSETGYAVQFEHERL